MLETVKWSSNHSHRQFGILRGCLGEILRHHLQSAALDEAERSDTLAYSESRFVPLAKKRTTLRIRPIPAPSRASRITLVVVFVISAALIGTTWLIHAKRGMSLGDLTRDPATVLEVPIYIGFLSQVGVLLWAATAAVCLLSGAILWRQADGHAIARFLLYSGSLTVLLGLDDAFLGHERIAPGLGIPEMWLYTAYAGATVLVLVVFLPVIVKTEYLVLGTALGFFAASVALDVFPPAIAQRFVLEDSLKLVGIVGWLAYFSRTALIATRRRCRDQGPPRP